MSQKRKMSIDKLAFVEYHVHRNTKREVRGVKVIIRGSPNEIAALVRATQERQGQEKFIPLDVIREAVRKAMNDTEPVEPC